MRKPLWVSFFTEAYVPVAREMSNSLDTWSLDRHIEYVEDVGTWVENCARKPRFLRRMLDMFPERPVVWIDADATVEQQPTVIQEGIDCDVAVHHYRRPNRNHSVEVLSGTVYLAQTYGARVLVDRWDEECRKNPGAWDQRALQRALSLVPGLRVFDLPVEYCWIFDTHRKEYPDKTPVILHKQFSRLIKRRAPK